jgi:hypothetical protein
LDGHDGQPDAASHPFLDSNYPCTYINYPCLDYHICKNDEHEKVAPELSEKVRRESEFDFHDLLQTAAKP